MNVIDANTVELIFDRATTIGAAAAQIRVYDEDDEEFFLLTDLVQQSGTSGIMATSREMNVLGGQHIQIISTTAATWGGFPIATNYSITTEPN